MDIVLGVSMTPTMVRMALVEGEKADGLTVDHDVFDVGTIDDSADSANTSAPEQVMSAILGTQQSALAGGHKLIATGVTWSDYHEAAALRAELASREIDDVTLVSELHAAGALAQAAGRAMDYDTTALLFVDSDTATLSVVEVGDASIVKVLSRSLHADDAMTVLTEMVTSLEAHDARPQGVFVVGSGVDVASVKEHLEDLVGVPVSAPEDAAMALARGAALAAAGAPRLEASTVGLAYSQDPDGAISPAFAATELGHVSAPVIDDDEVIPEDRRPFLLVGSTLTTIFVIGVVALVISLAVSIRPTANQRPNPHESVVVPSAAAPAPPAPEQAPAAPAVQPAPQTIPAPVPAVQEAPAASPPQAVVAPPPAPAAAPPAPPPAAEVAPPVAAPDAPPVYVPPPAYVPAPGIQIPPLVPRRWYPRHDEPPWGENGPPWQQPRGPVILPPPFAPSGPRNPFWPW